MQLFKIYLFFYAFKKKQMKGGHRETKFIIVTSSRSLI